MPKSKSRMSHHYFGEGEARPLIEWMNRVGKKKCAPVVDLYRRLLNVLLGPLAKDDLAEHAHEGIAVIRNAELGLDVIRGKAEYGREINGLRAELKKLHRWPELAFIDLASGKFDFRWTAKDEAVKAKLALVELAMLNKGALLRLRPCKLATCRKWFFARFKHQWFCRTSHQQSFYRQGVEWKEHRRKWSKEYRRLKASGFVK